MTRVETVRGRGHIQPPHAEGRFVDECTRGVMFFLQSPNPVPQGMHVVFAQVFDIAHFESGWGVEVNESAIRAHPPKG